MKRNAYVLLLAASALLVAATGCESNLDKVKRASWGDYTISYEKAFSMAFENGVWTETKDEKGAKVVRFTGTLSKGLHDFAVQRLLASDKKISFAFACDYLAGRIQKGKIAKDPDITFDPSQYPIRNGIFIPALAEGYFGSPAKQQLVTVLVDYYSKKYWAAGSEVVFQWGLMKVGRFEGVQPVGGLKASMKLQSISNPFWDSDNNFNGKPDIIMKIIFDYIQK